MSTLSKEQQKEIIKQLDTGQPVYLRCDSYLVCAELKRVKANSLAIVIYINGQFKGQWLHFGDDAPLQSETIRFLRPTLRNKFRNKSIKDYEKMFGKRRARKGGLYEKITVYGPHWLRPAPFVKHLVTHNEAIEVLSSQEHAVALEQMRQAEASDEQK